MNRRIAFPFLRLSDAAVEASPWELSLNGGHWQEVGELLEDWDPACDMQVRRKLTIDPAIAGEDIAIGADQLHLSVGVRIGTGQGRLPRRILFSQSRKLNAGNWETGFEMSIPGIGLSSVLDLTTHIVLTTPPSVYGDLSPKRSGDRLWSDTSRIRLEGEEPRFPVEVAQLSVLLGDMTAASAPWYLHWSPKDWTHDFHGAIRLYLNTERPDVVSRIQQEDGLILQVLMADVMHQVCERLVTDPESEEIFSSPEPGSLGAQAASWLRKAWPEKGMDFIKSVLESRPGTFSAVLLALAETRKD